MKDGQWTYSTHEDEYWNHDSYDTKEDAIRYGKDEAEDEEQDYFFVGQVKLIPHPKIDVERYFERVIDYFYDEAGEAAENYLTKVTPEHKKALQERLDAVFQEWLVEHGYKEEFYTIVNIEQIEQMSV